MKFIPISAFFLCCLLACKQTAPLLNITPTQLEFTAPTSGLAGEPIWIVIKEPTKLSPLLVRTVYGSQLIEPTENKSNENEIRYEIPNAITKQSGVLYWSFANELEKATGNILISPNVDTENIEVYIGPTTMIAGTPRSGMTTAVLTDSYDNVIADNHLGKLTTSSSGNPNTYNLKVKDGVIHFYHNASTKSGNLFTSVSSDISHSEEYTYQVNAANPRSCQITTEPQHYYADGSTPLTLVSNQLMDEYGNVVENGTLVTFTGVDTKGNISQVDGYTIDGVAKGTLVHPAYATALTLNALVAEIKSNTIRITFDEVIKSLPLNLTEEGLLDVGPLQSYMGQMIPDGLPITIYVYKFNKIIHSTTQYSQKGRVELSLPQVITSPLDSSLWILVKGAGLEESIAYKFNNE